MEEASSAGSTKLLIYVCKPCVVDTNELWKESVLMYPADARPVTVDCKLKMLLDPRPVENEEKERETKFVVEIKDGVEI